MSEAPLNHVDQELPHTIHPDHLVDYRMGVRGWRYAPMGRAIGPWMYAQLSKAKQALFEWHDVSQRWVRKRP